MTARRQRRQEGNQLDRIPYDHPCQSNIRATTGVNMTKVIPLLMILTATFPPPNYPKLVQPYIDPFKKSCPGLDYPAVMSVYDPSLGGINCDGDCTTVATGLLMDWMYEEAGACPAELLGATINFPALDHTLQCVDNGEEIKAGWSERDDQCVVYFDTLWHLEKEGEEILGAPYWTWWFIEEWSVAWGR